MKLPPGTFGRPVPSVAGYGLARPMAPHGSSSVPTAGRCRNSSYPNGHACDASKKKPPEMKSPFRPYPARTEDLPSPPGSHEMPTRGCRLVQLGFMPALVGNVESPGYVKPGNASG